MSTISKLTDNQLTIKIKNLIEGNFTKCKILNNLVSKTITLNCDWDGWEYKTNVYIEKITNPKYKYQIAVGTHSFPYSKEGIDNAVNYINY